MQKTKPNNESFFKVFDYDICMHDAIDFGLVYEGVVITQDVYFPSGAKLRKGDTYYQVNFSFTEGEFHFINWEPTSQIPLDRKIINPIPERSVLISQKELAPFLYWFK